MIDVACQTDARLLPDCAVMLHSLLTNNRDERFRIHFLCDSGTSSDAWQALADLAKSLGAEWSPTPIDRGRIEQLPFSSWYGGYTASYRLLLPDLLPDLDRVLYLDADIVVLDRLRALWDIDLNGRCVAAVTNPLYRHSEWRIKAKLGLPHRGAYFNSGVLLFDLASMRGEGLDRALVDWAIDHSDAISWPDQDVLNAVLWSRRLPLHPRWNAFGGIWKLPLRDLPWTAEEVKEARREPAIVHFIGPFKPWHFRCTHPYRSSYYAHLAQTGLRAQPLVGRTVRNWLLRPLPPLAEWTVENGSAELRAEIEHRVLSTTAGVEARDVYRRLRGHRADPITRVLEAFDATVANVVFVQIGSDVGEDEDPFRTFILAGRWRGVVVEPVPYLYQRIHNQYWHRPGVAPINAAIGYVDGTAGSPSTAPQKSNKTPGKIDSSPLESVLQHDGRREDPEERIVDGKLPTITIESLCRKHGIDKIDVFRLAADDHICEAIEAFNLESWRPTLLMFEHADLYDGNMEGLQRRLDQAGYDTLQVAQTILAISRKAVSRRSSHLARAWRSACDTELTRRP